MKIIQKYKNGIIIGALIIVGVCTVIFGKNMIVQGTITCLCWGVAAFIFSGMINQRGAQEMEAFEAESHEILKDIALQGEDSPYYGEIDIETVNKIREKVCKKIRKQVISCASLGVVLIIIAIICII